MAEIFNRAYRDANALIRQMWRQILLLLGLALAAGIVGAIVSAPVKTALGDAVVDLLTSIGASWLIAPYFVALYRFVLNGDRTTPARNEDAVRRFFGWSAVLNAIVSLPGIVLIVLTDLMPQAIQSPRAALLLILVVGLWVFIIRIATLLPATAAGRPMSLEKAFAETRGHFWFIAGATIVPVLPVLLVAFIASILLLLVLGTSNAALAFVPYMVAGLYLMLLGISVTSQLSQKFALPDNSQ